MGSRRGIRIAAVLLLLMVIGVLAVGYDLYRFALSGNQQPETIIVVAPGSSLRTIARQLAKQGLISSRQRFILLNRMQPGNTGLKAGEFRLPADATPLEIIATLSRGRSLEHQVTIPEGFTLYQIGARLTACGICRAAEFEKLTHAPELLRQWQIPANTLEGYLFPSTYNYTRNTRTKELLENMLATGLKIYNQLRQTAPATKLSRHQILTLASIIQKEAGNEAEMPLISSVFHNRLKHHMRLASDPTTIYALGQKFDGNLTRRDLQNPSPYNTYRHRGLPPGPICSPGRQALSAALKPAVTNYLYFVSRNDGHHYFSRTLKEHNWAVRRYQLQKKLKEKHPK